MIRIVSTLKVFTGFYILINFRSYIFENDLGHTAPMKGKERESAQFAGELRRRRVWECELAGKYFNSLERKRLLNNLEYERTIEI